MNFNLHLIAVVFFMMDFLAPCSGAKTTHAKLGRKKQVRGPCVGGKWIEVGVFRFWQRVSCALRRANKPQRGPPGFDMDDLPSMEDGPKRNGTYNPNYGYEPYWADGSWVFQKKPESKDAADHMCGTKCSKVYTEYGTICGRDKDFNYKTFKNYCHLQNADCHGIARWMIVYRGACYRDLEEYGRFGIQNRVKTIINQFISNNPETPRWVGFCSDRPNQEFAKKK